ncbi:MAG TPA: adenine phosphoribosyltransferase [Polyangiaceae bacterium]|nr:adenine phosphoribosyltransferase [Polyangiaceae bacterium]
MPRPPSNRPPGSKTPRPPARPAPTPRGLPRGAAAAAREAPGSGEGRFAYARGLLRNVPDFPKPGILFKDITPLLADPKGFHMVLDALAEHFIADHVDVIAGIEARGFIFGGALAARLNASFVPLRKPGKLPAETDRVAYDLEYGSAALEIHVDSIESGAKVVVVDDLLATGGTALAAGELVRRQGGFVSAYAFVVELDFLGGRARLGPTPVVSLLRFGEGD